MPPNLKTPPVLAIDIGTSSSRAGLFDVRGKRLPDTLFQRAYVLKTDSTGTAELDPKELLAEVTKCVKSAMAGWNHISGVGVSCFWHSFIGTDAAGNPLTPVYTWADSRCREDAAKLREELSEKEIHALTGCMLRSSFWPAKMRWLRRTQPKLFKSVRLWMSPAEWLQWKLTGKRPTCAHGMATGTGLYDPTKRTWSDRMLEIASLSPDRLNPISGDPSDWNGIPWHPGIGDGAASNLGCGATAPGIAAINIGTSAALRVMSEGARARAPFGLFCYRVDERRYLVGGAISNAGNLHAWCLRELRLTDNSARLEREMAARPTPDHGLTVLPYWTVERAPDWNESAQGLICGMTQGTTAVDMLQAISEASFYRLAKIADMIGSKAAPRWIVSGGILNSRSSLRRLANVFGEPVTINPEKEASLRGAAVYVLERAGAPIQQLKYGPPVQPDPRIHALYLAGRSKQSKLDRLLK